MVDTKAMKTKVLIPWFGSPPEWIGKFRDRVNAYQNIEFEVLPYPSDTRIKERLQQILGLKVDFPITPRKMCDYRPAYGELYADRLKGYDWWGWADLDCVFGDLETFLGSCQEQGYNLVTDHPKLTNGPFTVMQNRPGMNALYRRAPDVIRVFTTAEYQKFDEYGFSRLLKQIGDLWGVKAMFADGVHRHDGKEKAPMLHEGKLFSAYDGMEIMTYHFSKTKRWPL